jgi:dTDP-6-deoxy-L-talose 4-dehydrogenase (NAD+)
MKKILVTGATGFIGNYVIRELLNFPCEVIASSLHEERARQFNWYPRVKYVPLDLNRIHVDTDYFRYFGRPDVLIHLAWEGLPNYKSSFHIEENLPRHLAFLSNIIQNGLNDVTVTGTCFEYGMKEGLLSEGMQTEPANPYAIAKDSLRKHLEALKVRANFSLKWVRLFYMYGAGQNPKSILAQLEKAIKEKEIVFNMSGGEQLRDYLPVEKVAEYVVRIALQTKVDGVVNCCSGSPISIKQLVLDYIKKKGAAITLNLGYYPYPDYEPMAFWGDNRKLMSLFKS